MLGLPKATELSKQLPKKAIYEQFNMNTAAKAKFDADISRITIVGEITPNKVNIPAGDKVKNFFVLLVSLKRKEFDEKFKEEGIIFRLLEEDSWRRSLDSILLSPSSFLFAEGG